MGKRQSTRCITRSRQKRLDGVSQRGSHIKLRHPEHGNYMFGFHENEEIGPKMLAKIAKHTGLEPEDL